MIIWVDVYVFVFEMGGYLVLENVFFRLLVLFGYGVLLLWVRIEIGFVVVGVYLEVMRGLIDLFEDDVRLERDIIEWVVEDYGDDVLVGVVNYLVLVIGC